MPRRRSSIYLWLPSIDRSKLLICALGTLSAGFGPCTPINEDAKESDRDRVVKARQYFSSAQKRLGVCLGKRGVLEAQCFFYCGVYHATIMQPDAAWSMFLQALACCQSFSCLYQTGPEEHSPLASEPALTSTAMSEECTYWTCLKSEL